MVYTMSVILHIMPKSLPTKNNVVFDFSKIGGPEGDRTLDLRVANAALSQLSHEPVWLGWQDSNLRNARVKVWCLTGLATSQKIIWFCCQYDNAKYYTDLKISCQL